MKIPKCSFLKQFFGNGLYYISIFFIFTRLVKKIEINYFLNYVKFKA